MRFEVVAVNITIPVFSDVTPCIYLFICNFFIEAVSNWDYTCL